MTKWAIRDYLTHFRDEESEVKKKKRPNLPQITQLLSDKTEARTQISELLALGSFWQWQTWSLETNWAIQKDNLPGLSLWNSNHMPYSGGWKQTV